MYSTTVVLLPGTGGIEIERATKDFTVNDKKYEKGSYVIYAGQAFRPYLIDLMEKQNYPTRFQYPGGPPDTPYDLAGWTLPVQMGIDVDKIAEPFKAPSQPETKSIDDFLMDFATHES